jgi:hypothetical protein
MNENLALDFFQLLINGEKDDKIEAYQRVIDSAFKILNPVHEKIVGNLRNHQNQDAMILFQMAISKGLAIQTLINGVQYKNRESGSSNRIIDPTPIAAITRTQFEAFSTFHNIYNSSTDQNVINLLHDIWVIAGLKERQKGFDSEHPKHLIKAQKENDEIEKLIIRVKENPVFLNETKEKQVKIIEWINKRKFEISYRNNKLVLLPHIDMFINAGVNKMFEKQYSMLSWFVHPSNLSVMQFGQMFEKNFNKEQTYTFLHISRIIISMLIVEYCTYFPIAKEEFLKLPKIDQLLVYFDNKTYRSENHFSIEAWRDLEIELTKIFEFRK